MKRWLLPLVALGLGAAAEVDGCGSADEVPEAPVLQFCGEGGSGPEEPSVLTSECADAADGVGADCTLCRRSPAGEQCCRRAYCPPLADSEEPDLLKRRCRNVDDRMWVSTCGIHHFEGGAGAGPDDQCEAVF